MTGFLDRMRINKRQKLLTNSLLSDKPEAIHEVFTPEEIAAYRVSEEVYQKYNKGEERTVLTVANKTALAVALDAMSHRMVDYLAPVYQGNPVVVYYETQTVRGLISQDKIRQTKFKSIQRAQATLSQYLERWNETHHKVLFLTDNKHKKKREAYELTLTALREEYGIRGSEFGRHKY
ncbi:MAG TPA: hypothetical protein VGH19_00190 [Verrucomicrobiae bacterium]